MSKSEELSNKVYDMRKEAQINALVVEMLLHNKSVFGQHSIDDLYSFASNEFFTLDEKEKMINEAITRLEKQFNVKVISRNPITFETL